MAEWMGLAIVALCVLAALAVIGLCTKPRKARFFVGLDGLPRCGECDGPVALVRVGGRVELCEVEDLERLHVCPGAGRVGRIVVLSREGDGYLD